jgi:glycoside/pentoside/hexuronide:cation symporter, GPH family
MTNMRLNSQKVSFGEKLGYSMGDGAANLIFQMMMMFQLFFYTDVFGIKATAAGMILLAARLFDAFVDPVVGILSDRTNTRWGKYRPWILRTALPFAVFFALAFASPALGERGKILYAGVTYILLMSIYSFNNTPYSSLGGVMSADIKERTSISSIRFVTATVATFVVQGLTLPLVSKFGLGVGGAICGGIIDSFGFVANTVQTDHAVFGIKLTSSLIPTTTFIIGVAALFFYPISKKLNEQVQAEMEVRCEESSK